MKKYKLNTILFFGEYKGYSLKYLIEINTDRLFWYMRTNLEANNFFIDNESVKYTITITNELFLFKKSDLLKISERVGFELSVDQYVEMINPSYDEKSEKEGTGYLLEDYVSRLSKHQLTAREMRLVLNYSFNYWNAPLDKNILNDLNECLELNQQYSKIV